VHWKTDRNLLITIGKINNRGGWVGVYGSYLDCNEGTCHSSDEF
jgi:hypothetical protein